MLGGMAKLRIPKTISGWAHYVIRAFLRGWGAIIDAGNHVGALLLVLAALGVFGASYRTSNWWLSGFGAVLFAALSLAVGGHMLLKDAVNDALRTIAIPFSNALVTLREQRDRANTWLGMIRDGTTDPAALLQVVDMQWQNLIRTTLISLDPALWTPFEDQTHPIHSAATESERVHTELTRRVVLLDAAIAAVEREERIFLETRAL